MHLRDNQGGGVHAVLSLLVKLHDGFWFWHVGFWHVGFCMWALGMWNSGFGPSPAPTDSDTQSSKVSRS